MQLLPKKARVLDSHLKFLKELRQTGINIKMLNKRLCFFGKMDLQHSVEMKYLDKHQLQTAFILLMEKERLAKDAAQAKADRDVALKDAGEAIIAKRYTQYDSGSPEAIEKRKASVDAIKARHAFNHHRKEHKQRRLRRDN